MSDIIDKLKKSLKNNKNHSNFGRNITEQIPILKYESGHFLLKGNRLMNIFEIEGKSYRHSSYEELSNKVYNLARYYRMQNEEIKFVFMNYPANTSKQQNFLKRKLETANANQRKWLNKELLSMRWIEQNCEDSVAFVFIFADNENSYNRQIELLKHKSSLIIKDINFEKKLTILRKLNNMNMDIKV